ncbi:MAG: DUF6580 family putative transport protein [Bacteroidia bacterium]
MKTIVNPRFIFISAAVFAAALTRLLPHPYNFTPIGAIALFGGMRFENKKLAFIIPLLAMFLSDVMLQLISGTGFHNTMIFVYGSFALISVIGIQMRNTTKAGNIIALSLLSSILFFAITNFGVWAQTGFLAGSAGLLTTYVSGIPFFGRTVCGDLFFNAVLFGSFFYAQLKFPILSKVKA